MTLCLVTGGAGFIGSNLVRGLLSHGQRVRVYDNFSTGKPENLAGLDPSLEVVEGDLRDAARLKEALQGVNLLFHQAAMVSVPLSMDDPQTCFAVNVQGTLHLLRAARQAGVERVVLASSAAVYGDSQALPLRENEAGNPLSPYAASKLANEIYGRLYTRAFDLPVVALRYFNVYGPRQRPDSDYAAAIPIFVRQLLDGQTPTIFGDGHQVRDFIYVEDVVRANLLAAESAAAAGQAINVCTGQQTDLLTLLDTLARILQSRPQPRFAPPRPGDIYRSYGDPALARRLMGFAAQVDLHAGLSQTVEWMRL